MELVRFLLSKGVPPNPVLEEPANSSGKGVQHTALRGAALGGHAAVTRLLIDAGADGASTPRTASKRHTHWPPLNFRGIILKLILHHCN